MAPSIDFSILDKRDLLVAEKLLQVRDKRVEFATKYHRNTRGEAMDFTSNPFLPRIYNSLARKIVLQGSVQSKKAQPLTSKVHTPDGWKLMGDLKIGDSVSTPDGGSAVIEYIQPQGVVKIFKLRLSDGRSVEACGEHLWKIKEGNEFKILSTYQIVDKMWIDGITISIPIVNDASLKIKKYVDVSSINFVRRDVAQCISIDHPDGLYITDDCVVTHNSEFIIIDHFAMATCGLDVFFVLPKVESRTAYVQNRIDKALGMSPQYRRLVASGSFNNTVIKNLGNGTVKYVGSNALCLALDTPILTKSGNRPLEDLQVGDHIYSFDALGKVVDDTIIDYIPQGKSHTLRITTKEGVLIATPDHCIKTSSGWVAAKDLHVGDRIWKINSINNPVFSNVTTILNIEPWKILEVADISVQKNPCFFANGIAVHNSDMREYPAAACVISGSKIRTKNGYKSIEAIKEGEFVLSFTEDLEIRENKVLALIDQGKQETFKIVTNFGLELTCTDTEKFFTPIGWVTLRSIRDGSYTGGIYSLDGNFRVEEITCIMSKGIQQVWDLMVENDHSFIANDFLVHNCVIEELDECNDKNVMFAIDRVRGSVYQFERYVGNPSRIGLGINGKFMESDQHLWYIKCPGCHSYTELDWFKSVLTLKNDDDGNPSDFFLKDDEWKEGCGRDIYCMCEHCGHPINRGSAEGQWQPNKPNRDIEGFLLTMLMSWENSVTSMYEAWYKAWGSLDGMAHFWGSFLGKPFALGSARLTVDTMKRNSLLYDPYLFTFEKNRAHISEDRSAVQCSMGVDVGKYFDVRISQVWPDGTRQAVFIGKIQSRAELIQLGIRYNVFCCVIDSLPEFRIVTDFQEDAPFHVWSCRYTGEGKDTRIKRDKKTRMISLDRTLGLDRILSEYKAGRNILPTNFESIYNGDYVDEMTTSVRKEEIDNNGNTVMKWSKCVDHSFHADLYDFLASQFIQVNALAGISVG